MTQPTPPRLLRRRDVEALVGVKRSALYKWISQGEFPAPIRLGPQSVAWRSDELDAWISSRPRFKDECEVPPSKVTPCKSEVTDMPTRKASR